MMINSLLNELLNIVMRLLTGMVFSILLPIKNLVDLS